MAKTIITAALTGAVTPAGYHIPETPEQIVQAAYECWQLGAAVVHIHTRAADGKGAMNTQAFREIVEGIRAHKDCDVIINCTSSGASPEHPATDEERFLHHMTVPGIEMGSYDAGSFNWMPGGVFVNSPQFLQKLVMPIWKRASSRRSRSLMPVCWASPITSSRRATCPPPVTTSSVWGCWAVCPLRWRT